MTVQSALHPALWLLASAVVVALFLGDFLQSGGGLARVRNSEAGRREEGPR